MARRARPPQAARSERLLRAAVNEHSAALNVLVASAFGWESGDTIEWLSPMASDDFAEYYDQDFIDRLGIGPLTVALRDYWPASGPRWDGLARTTSGKVLLVEAKAHIGESVTHGTRAGEASASRISSALARAKTAFGASDEASWGRPFYQYTNRLAHLYFLHELNGCDAYMLFLYFADAEDVPEPERCTTAEWRGAIRLTEECLGLGRRHPFSRRLASVIWSEAEMKG